MRCGPSIQRRRTFRIANRQIREGLHGYREKARSQNHLPNVRLNLLRMRGRGLFTRNGGIRWPGIHRGRGYRGRSLGALAATQGAHRQRAVSTVAQITSASPARPGISNMQVLPAPSRFSCLPPRPPRFSSSRKLLPALRYAAHPPKSSTSGRDWGSPAFPAAIKASCRTLAPFGPIIRLI